MQRRRRLHDGSWGPLEKIGSIPNTEEQVMSLGEQLAQEKMKNIQKDLLINNLGSQLTQLKLDVISLKGGAE
ncbi:XkdW family protein [Lysinibacillus fusiformis]|uniref:XkdW family protein n=1 Tax=Lysinibacillus fusiformis TaxID=28031 RepID=UPI002E1CC9DF|nr:XkdW family protein [Lysinibacillus fusiformis]